MGGRHEDHHATSTRAKLWIEGPQLTFTTMYQLILVFLMLPLPMKLSLASFKKGYGGLD